jgi:uncharacterized SAM-binding protein YcdF (DUF218 family)
MDGAGSAAADAVILRFLALLLLGWVGGFVIFVLGQGQPADLRATDAIVVLTGGPGRLTRGLALLEAGRAKRMFVSGVGRQVLPAELAYANNAPEQLFACCVDLGHEAVDTRSNGPEVAHWVKRHGYRSVRLITTDWHMPRARFELSRSLDPSVQVVPDAVRSNPAINALISEYNKYLLRRVAVVFGI